MINKILANIRHFGIIYYLAYFIPVHFTQDCHDYPNLKHPDYERITFRSTGNSYFYGTHAQRANLWKVHKEGTK